jgi:hypothetical protein
MGTYRNKLFAAASVVVAAGTVAVSGLAPASASPAARPAASPAARPAASLSASGTEHFQIMTTSETARTTHVIASGVFTAGGTDVSGNKSDTIMFSGGTFKIRHFAGHGKQSFDPATCLLTINLHGTYKLKDGTGTYAGISGHGRYHLRVLSVAARNSNGKCSQRKQPEAFEQIIRAHGPLHL